MVVSCISSEFSYREYLESHSKGTLEVGRNAEKVYQLKFFAAFRASARDKAVFDFGDGLAEFIEKNAGVSVDTNRKILALSTCTEGDSVSRIVVFGYIE
ncbi:MAG: hypothetical protein IIT39_06785 [Clostridia bacterium]|nr:hypothetical protein [Clostridia bacterium]